MQCSDADANAVERGALQSDATGGGHVNCDHLGGQREGGQIVGNLRARRRDGLRRDGNARAALANTNARRSAFPVRTILATRPLRAIGCFSAGQAATTAAAAWPRRPLGHICTGRVASARESRYRLSGDRRRQQAGKRLRESRWQIHKRATTPFAYPYPIMVTGLGNELSNRNAMIITQIMFLLRRGRLACIFWAVEAPAPQYLSNILLPPQADRQLCRQRTAGKLWCSQGVNGRGHLPTPIFREATTK